MKTNIQIIRESTGDGTPIQFASVAKHLGLSWCNLRDLLNRQNTADDDPLILKAVKYIKDSSKIGDIERIEYLSRRDSPIKRAHVTKITGFTRQRLRRIFNNPKRYRDKHQSQAMNDYRKHLEEQGMVIIDAVVDKKIKSDTE